MHPAPRLPQLQPQPAGRVPACVCLCCVPGSHPRCHRGATAGTAAAPPGDLWSPGCPQRGRGKRSLLDSWSWVGGAGRARWGLSFLGFASAEQAAAVAVGSVCGRPGPRAGPGGGARVSECAAQAVCRPRWGRRGRVTRGHRARSFASGEGGAPGALRSRPVLQREPGPVGRSAWVTARAHPSVWVCSSPVARQSPTLEEKERKYPCVCVHTRVYDLLSESSVQLAGLRERS